MLGVLGSYGFDWEMLSQRKSLNNYGENFLIPTSGLSTYTPTQIWCMFTYARVHMNVNTQIQVHMYRMHICLKKEKKRTRVLHNKEKMLLKESKMIVCLFFYSSPIDQKKGPFPNAGTSAINLIPQLDIRWLSCIIPNWMVVFRCKSCVLSKGVNSVTFFFKNHSYSLILYWGGGMSVPQGRSEGHLQQSVLSFYTVGPAAGWLRASGLAASAFRQRPGDRTRVTGLAVSTFHLLRHLSNPLLPSSPPALYDTRDK